MNLPIARWSAVPLLLLALTIPTPTLAALSSAYEEGYRLYEEGDYEATVAALEQGWTGQPEEALLLGLARLRLDEPARAADAWAQYIRASDDTRQAEDVARLRTILVRDANRRAARAALERQKSGASASSANVVAVLPFRNVGSARFEPLGKAIAAMLAESLRAVPGKRVVGRGRAAAFLEAAATEGGGDARLAGRTGRMLGAGTVVVGAQVDTTADPMTLEVTSALIDTTTGVRVESGSFLAPLDRFHTAVRDTAMAVADQLGAASAALPAAGAARVQTVYTESLEAALAFGRGLALEDDADFDGARREYEAALRADPSFSLARDQLALLPATLLSLPAVALAVQTELPPVEAPVVVALATPEPAPEPTEVPPDDAATLIPTLAATPPAAIVALAPPESSDAAASASVAAAAGTTAAAVATTDTTGGAARPEPSGEEETTILGMSPMTAALVGGGVAIAIGGAAAALGGGGGGGNKPDPPTIRGVEDRRVSAGSLIVLNIVGEDPEDATVTLTQSGAPAAATFDPTSGNPANGTFRWQTTAADAGQSPEVVFTATASREPPPNTATATATLVVEGVTPTPTPPPTCGGTGAGCAAPDDCCQDIARQCEVTPAGGGARCCLGLTTACANDADCCGADNACQSQRCCAPLAAVCSTTPDCCDQGAACTAGRCCLPDGRSCTQDADCCDGRCTSGTCEAVAPPTATPSPVPTPTSTPICREPGVACEGSLDCCTGDCRFTPASAETLCCLDLGQACADISECCGLGSACDGTCCLPRGSACLDASQCCGSFQGCVNGRCCAPPGQSCGADADCCAGACVRGVCSSSLVADSAAASTERPAPVATPERSGAFLP